MQVVELNMDGLVGPTHHYAGLAVGNVASTSNALSISNPRAAAKQGLDKMQFLMGLGLAQGFMPPHPRPNLELLHRLGFTGTPAQQINKVSKVAPELLSACYSSSGMWTANAATVSPSVDTLDRKVHFTSANLISNFHRHQESSFSSTILEHAFANPSYFHHHTAIPSSDYTADEGAANHNRFAKNHAGQGLHLFVYGKMGLQTKSTVNPQKYPARQTLEASEVIARIHLLDQERVLFAQQNPQAIDAGIFHNDVISVANENVFLVHELAFLEQQAVLNNLRSKADFPLTIIEIKHNQMSLEDAVSSYLFNSQLLTLPNQQMVLLAPIECETNQSVYRVIQQIIADTTNPINSVQFLDLRQSMRNGGGPACLRLRVPLTADELRAMNQSFFLDEKKLELLQAWVMRHYRDRLQQKDLADPEFMDECFSALDELTSLIALGAIYPFQKSLS